MQIEIRTYKWENLPNAKYISKVIKSYEDNSIPWRFCLNNANLVNHTLWKEAWDISTTRATELGRYYTRMLLFSKTSQPVYDALSALIAWDDCAYMLSSKPADIELLAKLGDPKAILLYGACSILGGEK